MAPESTNALTEVIHGKNRVHIASIKKAPDSRAAAIICRTCDADNAIGFSHNTAFPCRKHNSACSA